MNPYDDRADDAAGPDRAGGGDVPGWVRSSASTEGSAEGSAAGSPTGASYDDTAPLGAVPPRPEPTRPEPTWEPVAGAIPARPSRPWDDYRRAALLEHQPAPEPVAGGPTRSRQRAALGAWLWPAVTALALVVGVIGGIVGSASYRLVNDPRDIAGTNVEGLGGVDTADAPPLPVDDGTVANVAEELLPSTVQIVADFQGQAGGATGSGFVIDDEGHIVTNNHVVADAAEDDGPIEIVDEEGNSYDATIVGRSATYDLAVLFAPDASDLEPAALGRSERLRVGEGVVALGSPLGLSSTVTSGIVSALQRPVTTTGASADDNSYINAVQTDAAINPGNSGGPLVNLRGQVVGVNSAIAVASGGGSTGGGAGNIGIGYAIPVEQVIVTTDQILRTGEARYPVIGAQVATGGLLATDGAEIDEVLADTPAADAGLEAGDVVTMVDGERVTDGKSLIVNIRSHQPGETIEFVYTRNGQEQVTDVTLGSETG